MFGYEPRSKYWYDDDDSNGSQESWEWKDILWIPFIIPIMFLIAIIPFLMLAGYFLHDVYSTLKKTIASGDLAYPFLAKAGVVVAIIQAYFVFSHSPSKPIKPSLLFFLSIGFVLFFTILPTLALCLHWIRRIYLLSSAKLGRIIKWASFSILCVGFVAFIFFRGCSKQPRSTEPHSNQTPNAAQFSLPTQTLVPSATSVPEHSIHILVDDFIPQPYQGDTVYYYNRLEGDRGALNNSTINWGEGLATVTIPEGITWGGLWLSLNHPIREGQSINFSAILPSEILPQYQSRITGLTISIARGTASKIFRAELKDDSNNLQWAHEIILSGEQQTLSVDFPLLQGINQLVLVLDHAAAGDFVIIDDISLTAKTPVTDTATTAFVWSYGMLLNNWNPTSGLVRDKAKDASGEFDAIQATGSLAAATALADQVGVIDHGEAVAIVNKIGDTLLNQLPRNHGLWPHWVKTSPDGNFEIVQGTEWSSVDTVIAAIGLLDAQQAFGLNTSATEQVLREIDWNNLVSEKGISHGYTFDNTLIPYTWDVFGGESWLVELAYASATGKIAPLAYPSAPTANGSGFIDELAWLYVNPPTNPDYWGTDWASYRIASADKQISYYSSVDASPCFAKFELFGLSAAEVPMPARIPKESIYQAFGMGGQFAPVNDGATLLGSPTAVLHYSAMIASLRPQSALKMWGWLIANGYFSPLNNVESLTFPSGSNCVSTEVLWNQLKGSWNLSLQTLGWGRYLVERDGMIPVLWQATTENLFLDMGYLRLAPNEPKPNAIYLPQDAGTSVTPIWDREQIACEGKPVNQWGSPGTYIYKSNEGTFFTVVLKPGDKSPEMGVDCPTGSLGGKRIPCPLNPRRYPTRQPCQLLSCQYYG
jgi:hypothetical protein